VAVRSYILSGIHRSAVIIECPSLCRALKSFSWVPCPGRAELWISCILMGSFFQVPERLNILLAVLEQYFWHYLRHKIFFEASESRGLGGRGRSKDAKHQILARNTFQWYAFTPPNSPHAHLLLILQPPPPLHSVLHPNLMSSEEPLWRDRPYTISTK